MRFIERPFCERCGRPYEGEITGTFECPNCRDRELHFRQARSAVVACDTMLEVIHRYKYSRALWFEPFLAELLIGAAKPELAKEQWDFVVPVPLYPAKQREREFNQAERLAKRLSAATQIPVNKRLLRRVRPTCTQTVLSRAEREENVRNAFAMRARAATERRAHRARGRRAHDGRHNQRLCQGAARRQGRRSLRLDSGARNLNTRARQAYNAPCHDDEPRGSAGRRSVLSPQRSTLVAMATTTFTKKTLGLDTAEPAVTPPPPNHHTTFVKKPKMTGAKSKKRDIPEGLWTKCPKCSTMVFDKELDENLKVCSHCQHHFPIGARERIHSMVETCTFEEMDADMTQRGYPQLHRRRLLQIEAGEEHGRRPGSKTR